MNFGDFPDGGTPAWHDYIVGYADGGSPGSDRRWLRSTLGVMNPDNNEMGLSIHQTASGSADPIGSQLVGFNEIQVLEGSSTNVTNGLMVQTILLDNWGSANSLIEKNTVHFETVVFTPPTGNPGPHQPVALFASARAAAGIGACPTLDLFAANFVVYSDTDINAAVGLEIDMPVGAAGSCSGKIGINAGTSGANGTAGADVAFVTGTDGIAAWHTGFSWFNNSIEGSIIGPYNDDAVLSCVNGIDFSTVTFSGSQIKLALGTNLKNAANDGAAAGAGVAVGEIYRNGSILMVRVA